MLGRNNQISSTADIFSVLTKDREVDVGWKLHPVCLDSIQTDFSTARVPQRHCKLRSFAKNEAVRLGGRLHIPQDRKWLVRAESRSRVVLLRLRIWCSDTARS